MDKEPSKKENGIKRKQENDVVASHYNSRPAQDLKKRKESSILTIRKFNNWVKAVLFDLTIQSGDKVN